MDSKKDMQTPSADVDISQVEINNPAQYSIANISGDQAGYSEVRRGLQSRHVQFLALGGAIGTGLFIGSGGILAAVGPAPLFLGYIVLMSVVWCMMNDLAEMVTYFPFQGATIPYYINRFVEPSIAFAAAWNYWYAFAILIGAEGSAGAILLDYWKTSVPSPVWIALFLIIIFLLNIIAVEYFGEAEFWFASIKFLTILGLIIIGIVICLGGSPNGQGRIGFSYWNNPGAFIDYLVPGPTGRFLAFWSACIRAGFAFIVAPEMVALTAGEVVAPRRNLPKAANRFIWRLMFFYGLGSLVVGIIVPSNDNQLLSSDSNASASPFVIGIQRAGISGLNSVINAAILTSAWSSGNVFLYSGSRILYGMALTGQAPRIFITTNKRGTPYLAVIATWCVGLLGFLNASNSGATVFTWLVNISTCSGFIAWVVVSITYLRFRGAMRVQGLMETRPFKSPLQPYATWFTGILIFLLTLTNGFSVFFPSQWSVSTFFASYITLPLFAILYFGHKIWFRTPWARKLEEVDLISGKREIDALCELDEEPREPKNIWEKVWFWIA